MQKVTATFEIVTPMFLGGADPAGSVALRAPSLKGALRFWWRALAWSRLNGDLKAIHQEEAKLFGAASDDQVKHKGQSSFRLRVRPVGSFRPSSDHPHGQGAKYLGYGLEGTKSNAPNRPSIPVDARFTAELTARKSIDTTILDALKLFGLLGGLGARTRRGWGSVALTSLEGNSGWQRPTNKREYCDQIDSILSNLDLIETQKYSAFSKKSRILVLTYKNSALSALNSFGQSFQEHRRDNRTFQFGLPLTIFRGDANRRASPMLVHLHRLEGVFAVSLVFFPAPFLPNKESSDYPIVNAFLNKLAARTDLQPTEIAFS